jgi:cysteine desulfurase/selenocysteine lyase
MSPPGRQAPLDLRAIRQEFPILSQTIHGKPLVYLDNAASTQKPRSVIDALSRFYATEYSNIHRGVHALSEQATAAYEGARDRVQRFLNARDRREIVFVRGTTEAINLVASTFGRIRVGAGDEVVLTTLEHHSNIVPWQMLCEERGARLRVVTIDAEGQLRMDELERILGPRTRMVAVAHVSNALGTRNPIRRIVEMAHAREVPVLVDGAQAAAHGRVDVQELGCDFYAFSGHKVYGPSGIGVLYGRLEHLERMPPYQGGGEMIRTVTFEKTTYADPPHRFEAGTPSIAGAVGLGAAIDYMTAIGLDAIASHEDGLLDYATRRLAALPGVRLVGTAREKSAVLSFVISGVHAHDVGTVLDHEGIAVRAGHHCAQPVMDRFGVPATARASFALYNTRDEIDALVRGIARVQEVFG